jgi:hypothetical protein
MARFLVFLLMVPMLPASAGAQPLKALFDNTLNETAGNADWIIDVEQPVPVPAQSGVTPSTTESYWLGAISAWGVELVKRGFTVHTLTSTYGITFGNAGNPYDLSNYDLFIICEPQNPLSAAEKLAIRSFVQNGGGLMMVADHNASDRDNDGWDSPQVWNDLGIDTYFGLHFQSSSESDNSFTQVATNVAAAPGDSIIHGAAGTVTALSYHAGTSIRLLTANNPTATGHVWMNSAPQGASKIMAATSRYGNGRVGAVGDSSPADDGTGQNGNALYNGWSEAGATDDILFLNMSLWLSAGGAVAPPAQAILSRPLQGATGVAVPAGCSWYRTPTADKYTIQVSLTNTFASVVVDDSTVTDTVRTVDGLSPNTMYYWRVRAHSAGGWGTYSEAWNFVTWTVPSQVLLQNPADGETGTAIPTVFSWQPASAATRYHLELDTTAAFTLPLTSDSTLVSVSTIVSGIQDDHSYFWHVRAGNGAGWGAYSTVRSFTTWSTPGQVQLVSPVDSAVGLGVSVQCVWQHLGGASAYQIQLSTDEAFGAVVLSDSTLTDTLCTVSGIDTLARHFWRVRARNNAGWGPFSGIRNFRMAAGLNVSLAVSAGWHIISVPVTPTDLRGAALFPSAGTAFFAYDAGYTERDTLAVGAGYWVRFNAPGALMVTGEPVVVDTVDVRPGWNLVGSLSMPVATATVTSVPPGIIVLPFYAFADGYLSTNILEPMNGYWLRCTAAGKIILVAHEP